MSNDFMTFKSFMVDLDVKQIDSGSLGVGVAFRGNRPARMKDHFDI